MGANGSNWYIEQPGWCHEMYSHLSYLPTEMLKKNSESKLLQLGEGVRGAYRKPLLRISRYSASEMDIFTEMDIFRKCKVFSGVKYKKFLWVFHLLPKDLEREYFDRCAGFCSGNWELGCQKVFLGCCFVMS